MTRPLPARDRIFRAAAAALIEGDGDVEMTDVAQRAGVSAGLAYHYFGSKAGLLVAVIGAFYDRYDEVLNQRFDRELSWPEREYRRLRSTISFLYRDPMAPVMLARLAASPEVVGMEAERREAMIGLAALNIIDGQKQGAIPTTLDPMIAAATVVGGVRQAVAKALSLAIRPPPDDLATQLWTHVAGCLGMKDAAVAGNPENDAAPSGRRRETVGG